MRTVEPSSKVTLLKLRPKTINKVFTVLAKHYNIDKPKWKIRRNVNKRSEGTGCYFGIIEFYGLPTLQTALHEFHHYYNYGRNKYGRRLDEYLTNKFVVKWYPFFYSLLNRSDQ